MTLRRLANAWEDSASGIYSQSVVTSS